MKAVCQRCGSDKPGPLVPCRSCTHVPVGEERTVAWLLSDHHLSPADLEIAARRIRKGERLAPPEALLDKARKGLEEAIPGRRRRPRVARQEPEPAPAEDATAQPAPAEDATAQPAPGEPTPAVTPPGQPGSEPVGGEPASKPEVATGEAQPEPTWTSAPSIAALLELDAAGPPGGVLPRWAVVAIATASVVITPLPAWVAWWMWRESAPTASRQVRDVALVTSAIFVATWAASLAWTWGQRFS
jgi:hypothetical protein